MSKFAPIVLFTYNRPEHTKKSIEALMKCENFKYSNIYIYSDGPKTEKDSNKVLKLRNYLNLLRSNDNIKIKFNDQNKGLADSIIFGVTEVLNKYQKIIVLEDDLIVTKYFINFMNDCLNHYRNDEMVWSATGFSFSREFLGISQNRKKVYFHYRPMSWTWATWKDRWDLVDWDVRDFDSFKNDKNKINHFCKGGKDLYRMLENQINGTIDSWYIRWSYEASKQKKITVYPHTSFVKNIGHDYSGVHSDNDPLNIFCHSDLEYMNKWKLPDKTGIENDIINNFNYSFNPNLFMRIKRKISTII